jgi:hypothetical protein
MRYQYARICSHTFSRVLTRIWCSEVVKAGDTVHVGAGVYAEERPIRLDTPSAHANTVWVATNGGVSVSGGVPVTTGWHPAPPPPLSPQGLSVVSADVTAMKLNTSTRHLFVNGARSVRARLPGLTTAAIFGGATLTLMGYRLRGAGPVPPDPVPCAANHGTNVACCGQPGNVTTQYQCPSSLPTCVQYVYNQHWGHCTASGTEVTASSVDPADALRPGTEMVFPQSTSPWTEPRCAVLGANASIVVMAQPCWANLFQKACSQNVRSAPIAGKGCVGPVR